MVPSETAAPLTDSLSTSAGPNSRPQREGFPLKVDLITKRKHVCAQLCKQSLTYICP